MPQLACVDVFAFPLQLLLKDRPEWRTSPVAVVAEERPQAFILWVNERARRLGIRPGLRYTAGLALNAELRAASVDTGHIERAVQQITDRLRDYSPEVEPADDLWQSPGLFWLNASGLGHLYPSLNHWAEAIYEDLSSFGLVSSIAVGFSRFGTYAVARSTRARTVFLKPEKEFTQAKRVALSRLDFPPEPSGTLHKLGVDTVGDLLTLPAKGLLKRFGPEVFRLHQLAEDTLFSPLQPVVPEEPAERSVELPAPIVNSERLLFFAKRILDDLLCWLFERGLALALLKLRLELDDRSVRYEPLRPACPTLDGPQLLGLVRLRLETLRLEAGVVAMTISAECIPRGREQLSLLAEKPRRDPMSRKRAFARLRAEFGEGAVVKAQLTEAHLPSARFRWVPFQSRADTKSRRLSTPKTESPPLALIRRFYEQPMALPHRMKHEPDGWMLRGLEFGPVRDFLGPYVLSGGWWRKTVHREYYFVRMQQGDVFWVFYDRIRRRWFLEGRVE